jgi:hypothetical protein
LEFWLRGALYLSGQGSSDGSRGSIQGKQIPSNLISRLLQGHL